MKQTYILIDGENTIHKLLEAMKSSKLGSTRNDILRLNLAALVKAKLGTSKTASIALYAARVHEVKNDSRLLRKTKSMIKWNGQWAPRLANQGIRYVKSGNLQVRDTKKCVHCGKKSLVLQEKGVDVRIATDILAHASDAARIVVVSSDSDLTPAMRAARLKGAEVIYVGFDFAINLALVAVSHKTLTFTSDDIAESVQ